ncbi:hypothetical protein [Streptomyces sp. HUAS TT20]|uniref:hypothetical protein n=1 Tax=Streptomyces sp. HUAS TT20 TaxID=3447509 RepID=UPI0021DB5DB6|nr:hypothetical protein [Streptomyces sp. HUAS 15-9]UXY28288.1 hypothetical protein N8I87_18045 [Streptomyces sp. HUAS 15-9]
MPVLHASHRRSLLAAPVLMGALIAPALLPVTTASAAPDTGAAATAPAAANPAARYAGKSVAIGQDMVAVLRNDPDAGGPEAWIRAVQPDWRQGDAYMYRVLDKLDRSHGTAEQRGLSLSLVGAEGSAPALKVAGAVADARSGTHTYPLPKAGTPDARGCTVIEETSIGAGTAAVLSNGPGGPSAFFKNEGDGTRVGGVVNRAHPALPRSAGFVARIIDPYGKAPKLLTNMEGGGHPAGTTAFPAPGCVK